MKIYWVHVCSWSSADRWLHLSDQQFYCQLRCELYQRFDGIWRHRPVSKLAEVMACCLTASKPLPQAMSTYQYYIGGSRVHHTPGLGELGESLQGGPTTFWTRDYNGFRGVSSNNCPLSRCISMVMDSLKYLAESRGPKGTTSKRLWRVWAPRTRYWRFHMHLPENNVKRSAHELKR